MAQLDLRTAQETFDASAGVGATDGPPRAMTFEEYLTWHPAGRWAEWVDGSAILLPLPTDEHQDLASFLVTILRFFCDALGLGRVFMAGYPMKLGPAERGSAREPDILFVAREHQDRFSRQYLQGGADLAIEVVSPDSVTRDQRDKYREYEAAGIGEYWVVNPLRQEARFYRLGPDGRYQLVELEDGVFRSVVVPGFWLRVEWLWQEPLPSTPAVLHELGVV